jgi:hypothetical protein
MHYPCLAIIPVYISHELAQRLSPFGDNTLVII